MADDDPEGRGGREGVIVSVGSINADVVLRVDQLPDGPGTFPARDLLRAPGGKAANVAVLARRLGVGALLVGAVGDDDLAEHALAGPRAASVDLRWVRSVAGPTGLSAILVPPDGSETIVLALGANDGWEAHAEVAVDAVASAPAGSIVVIDLEIPVACSVATAEVARRAGFPVVVDPSPPDRLSYGWVGLVDHVTPNADEAERLTGIDVGTVEGAHRAAEALRQRFGATAYVKLPAGGCVVATGEGAVLVEPPGDVAVEDATGAGDGFAGALSWALLQGLDVVEAARMGVAASTCTVQTYGSQAAYPDLDGLRAMARRVGPGRPLPPA